MRASSVSPLLLTCLLATAAWNLPAEKAVLTMAGGSQDCPVAFSLRGSNRGALSRVQVADGLSGGRMKRSVQVLLRSQDGQVIISADITLYAPRVSNRAIPAQAGETDRVTKTYHVAQDRTASGPLTGEFALLESMAGVERASIENLTYADGSLWRPLKGAACVATPQNLIEVAQR